MKITHLFKAPLFGLALGFLPLSVSAQVPTQDIKTLLQQLAIVEKMTADAGIQTDQLTKIIEQVKLLDEQLGKLQKIQELISDPSQVLSLAMGGKLDGLLEGKFNTDMVATIMSGAKGDWGGFAGSASADMKAGVDRALAGAGTSQEQITKLASSDNPLQNQNAQKTASSAATSAAAEVAYKEAGQSVERVGKLVDRIPELKGLKESVDHNTRVTAELAIGMAAMWQLESVQTMNNGMGGVLDAATYAEIQKFNDFTIPDVK